MLQSSYILTIFLLATELACLHAVIIDGRCNINTKLPFYPHTRRVIDCLHGFRGIETKSRHDTRLKATDKNKGNEKSDGKKRKDTTFERNLEDFIGKKFGAGEAFYGKRATRLTEEEYAQLRGLRQPFEEEEDLPLKENAILVIGDFLGDCTPAQWIVFELLEKGFAVRIVVKDRKEGIQAFGSPGKNCDMVYLDANSDEKQYSRAIQGVQGIVLCGSFEPAADLGLLNILPIPGAGGLPKCREEAIVMQKIISITKRAKEAKVGQVSKIVAVSRKLPELDVPFQDVLKSTTFDELEGLWIPKIESSRFDEFRSLHDELERAVIKSGIEYIIVRAPPRVDLSRDGATFDLLCLAANDLKATKKALSVATSTIRKSLGIGVLDLAEASVQALLNDVEGRTFTVCEDPTAEGVLMPAPGVLDKLEEEEEEAEDAAQAAADAAQAEVALTAAGRTSTNEKRRRLASEAEEKRANVPKYQKRRPKSSRVPRLSYYGILNMDDSSMKMSYMIKPADAYRSQLDEDSQVEEYWNLKLRALAPDDISL